MCSMTWYESFHTIFLEFFFLMMLKRLKNDFHTVKILHLIVTLLDEKTHHRDTMLLLYVSVYAASAVFIFHDIFITFVCGLEFVFFSLWIFPFFLVYQSFMRWAHTVNPCVCQLTEMLSQQHLACPMLC